MSISVIATVLAKYLVQEARIISKMQINYYRITCFDIEILSIILQLPVWMKGLERTRGSGLT